MDWERGRLRVPSPKAGHHEGKDSRIIPIFPELYPYVREVFEQAPEESTYVITRYRDEYTNLRTHFLRINRKAGLQPWAKPWHNLRSTRQTELVETHPIHVVCAWLGNSRAVAQEHYLQLTDAHFDSAAHKAAHGDDSSRPLQGEVRCDNQAKNAVSSPEPALAVCGGSDEYPRQDSNL